jgi:pyruvate formate-lyase activating enzyme-like uncharacterized protein
MPEAVRRIFAEAQAFRLRHSGRARTAVEWRAQVQQIRETVSAAHIEAEGETVRVGELSPGCQACKAGRWDCIFVTMRCNLACGFCLRPSRANESHIHSALGEDRETLCARYARAGVRGVAFSGGEPFLEPEAVLDWVSFLRRELPAVYLWTYTNGLPLTPKLLDQLAAVGLNEIRFNLAATGYRHPLVTRMLKEAVARVPAVAIEVPAIPKDEQLLLTLVDSWAEAGVKYLNLHELVYQAGTPSGSLAGERKYCEMPDGHACAFHPGSAETIRRVLKHVANQQLTLAVNDCSLRSKASQITGRRALLAPFTLQPFERPCANGLAECGCLFTADRFEFVHPDGFDQRRSSRRGWHAARLQRLLPLSVGSQGQWTEFALLEEGEAGW